MKKHQTMTFSVVDTVIMPTSPKVREFILDWNLTQEAAGRALGARMIQALHDAMTDASDIILEACDRYDREHALTEDELWVRKLHKYIGRRDYRRAHMICAGRILRYVRR